MARQCTQPKRPRNAAWFKEKLMLAEAQEADNLDAYDTDCDDLSLAKAVLMANHSSCDPEVLSKVPYFDSYPNDMINQDVKRCSNIISYSEYLQETQDAVIQDTIPSTPNDLFILSLFEQMTDHVAHLDKENQINKMQEIDTFKEILSNIVKEKESLSQNLTVFKTESKEKESKYIDKEIVLEKNKELENTIDEMKNYQKGLHKGYDRFQSLLSQLETHGAGVSTKDANQMFLSTQNVAFVSYDNTSSTNEVNTAFAVSTSSGHNSQKEGFTSYTDDLISKGNQDNRKRDARNTRYKARDNEKRSAKQNEHKARVTIDGEGFYWTSHSEDDIKDYALMAFNSSNSGLDTKSSDIEDSPVNDRFAKVKGMHAVPPHMTGNYMPPKSDFGIDESKFTYGPKQSTTSESDATTSDLDSCESISSVETLETEYESDNDDEHVTIPSKEHEKPSFAFVNTIEHVKTPRETTKEQNTYSQNAKPSKRDWNGLMSNKLGLGYGFTKKACFVCGSFSHLIRDSDFHKERMAKQDNPHQTLKGKCIVDSGCSRHMMRNKAYLVDYQDFNRGPVAFGGSKIRITGQKGLRENTVMPELYNKMELLRPITAENKANKTTGPKETNNSVGTQDSFDAGNSKIEAEHAQEYYVLPLCRSGRSSLLEELEKLKKQEKEANDAAETLRKTFAQSTEDFLLQAGTARAIITNYVNTASTPVNAASTALNTLRTPTNQDDSQIPSLEDIYEGHRQEEGMHYDEVFAPVARIEAIKIFLAFASYMGFIVYQMDVKSAFLYGKIDEEVYVSQPPGFIDPKLPNKVYKFIKALYGLHQALRACVKTASIPIETKNPLVKDEEAADVDVHLYRSMIGSLMYLTASRPDIMRLISWQCKTQTIVATSTTEAEYVAAASCYGQVLWNQNQISKTLNDEKQIRATIDSKAVVVTEASIRSYLLFNDADGTACLTNEAIFQNLALIEGEGAGAPAEHQPTPSLTHPSTEDQPPVTKSSSSHNTIQDSRNSLKGTNRSEGDQGSCFGNYQGDLGCRDYSYEGQDKETGEEVDKKDKPKPTLDDSKFDADLDTDHGMGYIGTEKLVNEGRLSEETKELVSTSRPEDSTVWPDVGTADPTTPPTITTSIFDDEDIIMAKTLIKMNEEKVKKNGVDM
uniref:Putative ribonuclease H-like domain-containing protein n=1 Tax=Tanacetum cinerariifolium TaxID=118510 RepID=A0A6L2NQ97_TANCI|nr:putative ribonuclease H-like domain-containing protein [Tanacetum cinerariifolium]